LELIIVRFIQELMLQVNRLNLPQKMIAEMNGSLVEDIALPILILLLARILILY
jgi:hypothetical protein